MLRLCLIAIFACCLPAQLSVASAGYVRDLRGVLRPVLGVAGSFVLGEALASDVASSYFDSVSGCARTSPGSVVLSRSGVERADTDCEAPELGVRLEGDEVVIETSGVRLRKPDGVDAIERMGSEWYVLRAPDRLYALRSTAHRESIYTLPEASQ